MPPPTHPSPLLTDSLWHLMRRLVPPGVAGMLLVATNSFVDALLVGRWVGADALAGVSLVFPLTVLTGSLVSLLAAGGASVLSRAIGAGDEDRQRRLLGNLLTLSLVAAGGLLLLGYPWAASWLKLLGGRGAVLTYATQYYRVLVLGSFFTLYGLVSNALIRAEGNLRQAMLLAAGAVVANGGLAAGLVRGLGWGVPGVALATSLSMALYCAGNLWYFRSGRATFAVGALRPRLDQALAREILSVGLSAFLMQATNCVRQVFIFKSVAAYGTAADLAFFGAVYRVFSFSVLPAFGFFQALQPIVGISYGAGRYGRSVRAVWVFRAGSIALLAVLAAPSLVWPGRVLGLLLPGFAFSAAQLGHFRQLISVLFVLPLASTGMVFFQATGQGKIASTLSLSRELVFAGLILLVPFYYGEAGIYYTLCLENVAYAAVMVGATQLAFRRLLHRPVPAVAALA